MIIKEDYCSDVEAKIRNILSPGWRKKNISPEVLDRINKLNEKLKTIEDNLRDLK